MALGLFIAATSRLIVLTLLLPRWLVWVGAVLAPLLVLAGWNFVLTASAQYAAYSVLLLVLLLRVAAVGVVSLRRAA